MNKQCRYCNTPFEADGRTHFCTLDCRIEYQRRYRKEYMTFYNRELLPIKRKRRLKPKVEKVCSECGSVFHTAREKHYTCSKECGKIRHNRRASERYYEEGLLDD